MADSYEAGNRKLAFGYDVWYDRKRVAVNRVYDYEKLYAETRYILRNHDRQRNFSQTLLH